MKIFKEHLLDEAQIWLDKGIINSSQAYKIFDLYGLKQEKFEEASNKSYKILMVLGFLMLAISLLILIGENWENVPRWIRMSSLVLLTVGIHSYGMVQLSKNPNKSTMFFFLGSLVYGIAIVLIAQMYHLGEHMPDGVFWWSMGVLPFVFLTRSNWMMILFLLLGATWFFIENAMGYYKFSFFIFLIIASYALLNYKASRFPFIITLFVSLVWFSQTLYEFIPDLRAKEFWVVNTALLISLYGLSGFFEYRVKSYKEYAKTLQSLILLSTIFLFFMLTFKHTWGFLLADSYRFIWVEIKNPQLSLLSFIITFSLIILGLFLAKMYNKINRFLLFFVFLFTSIILIMFFAPSSVTPIAMQILFNILFIIFSIFFVIEGMNRDDALYFFLGIGNILVLTFIRYFHLIGGYIGSALLFFILALIMLGSAKYWNTLKKNEGVKDEVNA